MSHVDRAVAARLRYVAVNESIRPGAVPRPPTGPDRPLRVLMVCPMPWRRDLGGPRVQMELGEALEARGHTVEVFSREHAVALGAPPRLLAEMLPWFARHVHRKIRGAPHAYDAIDAHVGTITASKRSLGFAGRLVVRSPGLPHFYGQFRRRVDSHRSPGARHWMGRRREELALLAARRRAERSLDIADRIIVHNGAELDFLRMDPRWAGKSYTVPAPLSRATFEALSAARKAPCPRRRERVVSFVGRWNPRKGSEDWPTLVDLLADMDPSIRFRLIGTDARVDQLISRFGSGRISCIPRFSPDQLPQLLEDVSAAAFPSYLEGWGIAVTEQLASGIPVVAYDVPGPRDILSPVDPSLLVRPGDVGGMARKIVALLSADAQAALALHQGCVARAAELTWDRWIHPMVGHYGRAEDLEDPSRTWEALR